MTNNNMDKTNLKFNVGDVVTFNGVVNFTIKSIGKYGYNLDDVRTYIPFRNQDAFRLVENADSIRADVELANLCSGVITEDKRFEKFQKAYAKRLEDIIRICNNGSLGDYSKSDIKAFAERDAVELFNIATSSNIESSEYKDIDSERSSSLDTVKLNDMLEKALSKETAESWNERLKLRELADDDKQHLGWLDDANVLEDERVQKVWHNADEEKPISDVEVVCVNYDGNWHISRLSECDDDEVETWAYINALLNPDLRYASINNNLEEVISKELENYLGIGRGPQYEKCYSEDDMKNIARYMAKWQKQQDDSIPQELIAAYKANVEAGNKKRTPDYLDGFFDGTQSMQKIADKCADDADKLTYDKAYEDGRQDIKREILDKAIDCKILKNNIVSYEIAPFPPTPLGEEGEIVKMITFK